MAFSKLVGKGSKSDISISGKYVSENHAHLIVEKGRVFIEDLNSTFGTHVNGKRISSRTELSPKDKVRLGTQLFHWEDCLGNTKSQDSPIYMSDLFSPFGLVTWEDYKVILLIAMGSIIIIPFGIPTILHLAEYRLNSRSNGEIELTQYSGRLIIIALLIFGYIFLNLTQKAVRNHLKNTDYRKS